MSSPLLFQAVQFGFAADVRMLVDSLRRRFSEIVPAASEHGLSEAEVSTNLAALDALEGLHGTSTGPDLSCTMDHSG